MNDLTAAQAQSNAELDQERAGRKKVSEEVARLQQDLSQSAQARDEFEARSTPLQARVAELVAEQAQAQAQYDSEIAERKKALDEIARLRQEILLASRAQDELWARCEQLEAQVKDLSATRAQSEEERELARAEIARLQREAADAARAQKETEAVRAPGEAGTDADRALRQTQEETIERLKAAREALEEQSSKRVEELTQANEALRQEFQAFKDAAERAGKPEEGWASRLFSSRKKKTDEGR